MFFSACAGVQFRAWRWRFYPGPPSGSSPGTSRPSRPGEFHPQPLTDPYVNLSIHTARASPDSCQGVCSGAQAPPIAGWPDLLCWLAHPLRSSTITVPSSLLRDDPPLRLRIRTFSLVGPPLVDFPFASQSRFPRSTTEPGSSSCHLYAGCHSGSTQVSPELFLEQRPSPISTSSENLFDASSGSLIAHLLDPHLTYLVRLFLNAHDRGFCPKPLEVV